MSAHRWPSPAILNWIRDRVPDPKSIPDEPVRMLPLREVTVKTGLSRSTILRKMAAGEFPKPVIL
jgi:predicted DNA-binding transcriptional regulator AlpA